MNYTIIFMSKVIDDYKLSELSDIWIKIEREAGRLIKYKFKTSY
jgi:hypothetical protein